MVTILSPKHQSDTTLLDILNFEPQELQRNLVDVVTCSMSAALQCGVGAGKTVGLAVGAHIVGSARPGPGIWFGEKATAQSTSAQPIAEAVLGNLGWRFRPHPEYKYWQNLNTGFRMYMRHYNPNLNQGAQKAAAQGSSTTLIIADECQDLQARFWRFARGRNRLKGPDGEPAIYIFAGLPALRPWWVRVAMDANRKALAKGRPQRFAILKYTTHVNTQNLTDEFFDDFEGDDDDYQQLIMNDPQPEEGLVWSEWSEKEWPDGNLVRGWKYDPSRHSVRLAIDFGRNWPAVLFIASDRTGLDVVFDELCPDRVEIDKLAHLILRKGWPRTLVHQKPSDVPYLIDTGSGDPTGSVQKGQTGTKMGMDAIQYLMRPPQLGGIGISILHTWDKVKRDVAASIRRTRRRIRDHMGVRTLACTEELWNEGLHSRNPRTFAKMIVELHYAPNDNVYPKGSEAFEHDHLADALRYDTINFAYHPQHVKESIKQGMDAIEVLGREFPVPAASLIRQLGK